MFDATSWTGNGAGLPKTSALNLLVRERPAVARATHPIMPETNKDQSLRDEYAKISAAIGFSHPHVGADLAVEDFKDFLRKKDWAVFSLEAVAAYMDKKAADESAAQAGWHWRPLRVKDDIKDAKFGSAAYRYEGMPKSNPASDHYHGSHSENRMEWSRNGNGHQEQKLVNVPSSGAPYDKLVPLHALRKVAAVEAEYGKPVAFFVCDYAPAPHVEHPDPFLMAVVNNARLDKGYGRFVIDFWDEPGFGLEQQLTAP